MLWVAVAVFMSILAAIALVLVLRDDSTDMATTPPPTTVARTTAEQVNAETTTPTAERDGDSGSGSTVTLPTTTTAPTTTLTSAVQTDSSVSAAEAESLADGYLQAAAGNDIDEFVALWAFPANHYGTVRDLDGLTIEAERYFANNPERSFIRTTDVRISQLAATVVLSFSYRFDLTEADGERKCGTRNLEISVRTSTDGSSKVLGAEEPSGTKETCG